MKPIPPALQARRESSKANSQILTLFYSLLLMSLPIFFTFIIVSNLSTYFSQKEIVDTYRYNNEHYYLNPLWQLGNIAETGFYFFIYITTFIAFVFTLWWIKLLIAKELFLFQTSSESGASRLTIHERAKSYVLFAFPALILIAFFLPY